ncbi:MAG: TVP38/TMEM64 family protein [Syntrophaceae bacterium]|nr:TVP38/TMEM64 family protein [Syntrophaceae bacterium]
MIHNAGNNFSQAPGKISKIKIALGLFLILFLAGTYFYLSRTGALATLCDCDSLNEFIVRLGVFGPMAVIGLMVLAIVMSPFPSAPIALAAGMAYGHTWGTIYVVIGAEIGALVAFTIGRLAGYEVLSRWFGRRLEMGLLGSQNALTAIVLIGRSLPFISFDILSYAAGLTPLSFWRFAVATFAGIIPISFLLTHFGSELGSADMQRVSATVLALGGITLIPIGIKWFVSRRRSKVLEKRSKPW